MDSQLIDLVDLDEVRPVPFAASAPATVPTPPVFGMHELAGQLGAEVAAPLSAALERVNLLTTTGKIGRGSLRALREEIERARRTAMMGQQISRMAGGRVKVAPEALDLPQLMRDMLSQRALDLEARGLGVRQIFKPAQLSADPALMFTLLQAVLDWSIEHCRAREIHVITDTQNWPAHARLKCEFAWRPADEVDDGAQSRTGREGAADARKLDTMAWRLIERTAHTMGVLVERDDTPWQVRVAFEFPRLPELPARAGSSDLPLQSSERMPLKSEPVAGRHALIVSARREVRNLVREALRGMGLMVDYVTSIDEARAFCKDGMPHAVVCDAALSGSGKLGSDLQAETAGLAFLQITEDVQALEVATRGQMQQTRIGLRSIVESLPAALVYALERAR